MSITSARGELVVHYQLLSKMSVDSVFDANWKEEVEDRVSGYSSLSEEAGGCLFRKNEKHLKNERKIKNNKTGGSDGSVRIA